MYRLFYTASKAYKLHRNIIVTFATFLIVKIESQFAARTLDRSSYKLTLSCGCAVVSDLLTLIDFCRPQQVRKKIVNYLIFITFIRYRS